MYKVNEAVMAGVGLLMWSVVVVVVGISVQGPLIVEWEVISTSSGMWSVMVVADWMSLGFGWAVVYISSMVMFYASSYMDKERFLGRFVWIVLVFVASMNCLIFIPSLWGLMIGWDGLGVSSFLLVVYYQNNKSLSAGMLTVLTNRLGDVLIIVSIYLVSSTGQFSVLWGAGGVCSFYLVVAAMTKSAQLPFMSWLPAAMAAPTPVSALVHSSTLVTAGVYLLIRSHPGLSEAALQVLCVVATATLVLSSLSANIEHDLKKVVALSTLSQLAMMMLALSVGSPTLAFYHMMVHALLKALLFMAAGSLIHGCGGTQDIRGMGGMAAPMPLTTACFCVSSLALCGFPFVGAFFTKDLILEWLFTCEAGAVVCFLVLLSAMLSVSYTVRVSQVVVFGWPSGPGPSAYTDAPMEVMPMLGLVGGAVAGGALMQSWFLELSPHFFLPLELKLSLLLAVTVALVVGVKFSPFSAPLWLKHFLASLGFLNHAANPLSGVFLRSCSSIHKNLDQGWMELVSGKGAFRVVLMSGKLNHHIQSICFNAGIGLVALSAVMMLLSWYAAVWPPK
uniref:NADH-ubiquinone oxidoreductase chain 5 n=1 Tax=Lyonsia norwegica TaxID=228471 RepID=A0A1U9XPH8_LYONO|nr:NADH dehydrogenase subunit 5 [Lyonsia norwegica]AQZ26155.1 NADH dehydrogenase subunit 5 [Lyonsia norwegica]